MKLQEHTVISPCSLAVFAAGHPWWWHMSKIYKYNLNSTLHTSSDSLQIKVYYNLKRHFVKLMENCVQSLLCQQTEGFIQTKKSPETLESKSSKVFFGFLIRVSSWRCLTLEGPECAPKYTSMGGCEKEPVKIGKQDPPLLITEWWKPDSKATCYSDPKRRIWSVK